MICTRKYVANSQFTELSILQLFISFSTWAHWAAGAPQENLLLRSPEDAEAVFWHEGNLFIAYVWNLIGIVWGKIFIVLYISFWKTQIQGIVFKIRFFKISRDHGQLFI